MRFLGLGIVIFPLVADALNSNDQSLFILENSLLKEFDNQEEMKKFKKRILDGELSVGVMLFYKHWCGHCKRFAPKFEAATKENKELIEQNKVGFRAMDCAAPGVTCPVKSTVPKLTIFFACSDRDDEVCDVDLGEDERDRLVVTMPKLILQLADNKPDFTQADVEEALESEVDRLKNNPDEIIPNSSTNPPPAGPKWNNEYLDATTQQMLYDTWVGVVETIASDLFLRAEDQLNLSDQLWQNGLEFVKFYLKNAQNKSIQKEFQNLKEFMEKLGNPKTVEVWQAKIREYYEEADKRLLSFDGLGELPKQGFRVSSSCNNYTCRVWHGFHSTAEGIAPENKEEMYKHLNNFRENFFGCRDCYEHMTKYMKDNKAEQESLTPAMYLFKFHNSVTKRTLKDDEADQGRPIPLYPPGYAQQSSQAPAFPPKEKCPMCLDDDDDDASNNEKIQEFLHGLYVDENTVVFEDSHGSNSIPSPNPKFLEPSRKK